jgi:hypothetical protein
MMDKSTNLVDDITTILTEFALTKFPVQALEVRGPVHEGAKYRWRIVSTRYKEVTVVLKTSKPLFRKLELQAIEVFGTTQERALKPSLEDLRAYFEKAELVPLR